MSHSPVPSPFRPDILKGQVRFILPTHEICILHRLTEVVHSRGSNEH